MLHSIVLIAALVYILIHFTGAKFLRNNLKETGDMAIFVFLCKIIHFKHGSTVKLFILSMEVLRVDVKAYGI